MQFRCISSKTLLRRLPSSASGCPQPLSQVISVLVARFFTGSSLCACCFSSKFLQQHKLSRNVLVSVWWDFENCKLPGGVNAFKVAQAITTAVKNSGIRGPISITAFGDFLKLSKFNRRALFSAGIDFQYVPQGEKTSASLMSWLSKTPTPAHIFLISSDTVFASALHRLRSNNYNILLASKTCALDDLSSAATIMWDWCSLVEGKNVAGIHFNLPPHRDYLSCYGLIPLQDPFAANVQSSSVKTEESLASNSELNSEESTALSKTLLQLDFSYGPSTPFNQRVGENETDKSNSLGFFDWILKWFKFREKDVTAVKLGAEPRGTPELVSDSSPVNEIFIKESLWREIEPFINSPRGFTVISHSKTREGMARNLQKEGPSCLKPLSELDMLHLVDSLISEKKWIEESPSKTLPFRVTQVTWKSSGPSHSRTGLRSILDAPKSHSPTQGEKWSQSVAHAEVSVATVVDGQP